MKELFFTLFVIILTSGLIFADRRQGRTQAEIEKFKEQYQMNADENKQKSWARNHTPDYSTPVKTAYTIKAFIINGDKSGFLTCLTSEYKNKNYPNGIRDYIKYTDYAKYYWLTMIGNIMDFNKSDESSGILRIKYTFKSNNRIKTQIAKFMMKKQGNKWLFNSL